MTSYFTTSFHKIKKTAKLDVVNGHLLYYKFGNVEQGVVRVHGEGFDRGENIGICDLFISFPRSSKPLYN